MAGGRPTKYTKATNTKAIHYLENYNSLGDAIPSIAGLADYLQTDRVQVQKWGKHKDNGEFSCTLDRLKTRQERVLLCKGLTGDFNSNIVKLALGNHGYSDKQETKLQADVEAVQLTTDERKQRLRELEIEREQSEEI